MEINMSTTVNVSDNLSLADLEWLLAVHWELGEKEFNRCMGNWLSGRDSASVGVLIVASIRHFDKNNGSYLGL